MRAFLERRAAWIAAAVALTGGLMTMTSYPVGVFYDDAIYLLTAKALAEGHGYVYAFLPGSPPAIHYPPLWPAILAVAWKIAPPFPGNIAWFNLINPLMIGLAAAGTVVFARRVLGLPNWLAFGAAVVSTVSIPVLVLTNVLLSEPLFLALIFPTLLVSERFMERGGTRWAMFAAGMAALLVLGRTIGGVVVIAVVMVLLLERRWRDLALYSLLVGVMLGPWQYFVWQASPGFPDGLRGSYGPYLEWVVDGYHEGGWPFLRDVVAKNTADTWRMVSIFFSPLIRGGVRAALTVSTFALLFTGLALIWRRHRARVTSLAVAGYFGVVMVWPFQVGRFVWALWPLLLLIVVVASHEVVKELRANGRVRAAYAVMFLAIWLGAGNIIYNVRGLARGWASSAVGDSSESALLLVHYINADQRLHGKVIATEVPPMVALYTGQMVVPVEMLTTREHIEPKTLAKTTSTIERIDREFRPDAYVLFQDGSPARALMAAQLDSNRRLVDIAPVGVPVTAFLIPDR